MKMEIYGIWKIEVINFNFKYIYLLFIFTNNILIIINIEKIKNERMHI